MKEQFLRIYNFFRIKNKKLRMANNVLSIVALLYLAIVTYPNLFFEHSFKYKNYTIYATTPIDSNIEAVINETETKLLASEIYDKKMHHDIYICNDEKLYTFFALFARKAFACNMPFSNNIFVANGTISKNEAYKYDSADVYTRPLSHLFAHEITHSFIEKEIGFLSSKILASWKNEGYCEFIGYGKDIGIKEDLDFLKKNANSSMRSDYYKKSHIAVNYLKTVQKITFKNLVDTNLSLDQVMEKVSN